VSVIGQWVSDEAIVDVKRIADDGVVTHLRIKLSDSNRKLKSKG
jgi:hypothetical protein